MTNRKKKSINIPLLYRVITITWVSILFILVDLHFFNDSSGTDSLFLKRLFKVNLHDTIWKIKRVRLCRFSCLFQSLVRVIPWLYITKEITVFSGEVRRYPSYFLAVVSLLKVSRKKLSMVQELAYGPPLKALITYFAYTSILLCIWKLVISFLVLNFNHVCPINNV